MERRNKVHLPFLRPDYLFFYFLFSSREGWVVRYTLYICPFKFYLFIFIYVYICAYLAVCGYMFIVAGVLECFPLSFASLLSSFFFVIFLSSFFYFLFCFPCSLISVFFICICHIVYLTHNSQNQT